MRRTAVAVMFHCRIQEGDGPCSEKPGSSHADKDGLLGSGVGQWTWDIQDFAPDRQVAKFDHSSLTLELVHEMIELAVTEWEVRGLRPFSLPLPPT